MAALDTLEEQIKFKENEVCFIDPYSETPPSITVSNYSTWFQTYPEIPNVEEE